nr:hypothetical protein [Tanacetum cinerariifolium]
MHLLLEMTVKGRSLDEGEEAAEKRSNDTEEMVNVLTSLDAATVLTSGVSPPGTGVPTGSDVVPTASPIFTTATESTPYTRRKSKEIMVESETPKKKKVQEQIDVQLARELEEEMAIDAQRMNEQIARDAKIARIHAEEELQMLIDRPDKNNETVAKYLQEYHQFATQQRKSLSRKQQRDLYTSVLRSHAGWKAKHFKGMALEEIKEKFDPVWKQMQDFIPMGSKEESERFKRKGLRLEKDSAKKVKTSEEMPEEKLKEMMQLIPVKQGRIVRNKMHKAFPLSVKSSHCQKKFPLLVRKVPPAEDKRCHNQEDCTAIEDMGESWSKTYLYHSKTCDSYTIIQGKCPMIAPRI